MRSIGAALSLLLFLSCTQMKKPLVIGHRGAMGHETENTLASVQKALDLGVDGIEIDVFKIKSGETIVFHDKTLERLTNGKGKIEDHNNADLQQLTLNGNHKIPLLKEVLELVDNKVLLNIELKGADTAEGVDLLMKYYIKEKDWSPENFIISSFNWDELRDMRKLNPNVAIAILTEDDPLEAIPVAKELGAEAINPNHGKLTAKNNLAIQEAGFKIYTWTVNEPQDIIRMKRFGVDGIITNFPERIN